MYLGKLRKEKGNQKVSSFGNFYNYFTAFKMQQNFQLTWECFKLKTLYNHMGLDDINVAMQTTPKLGV